MTRADLKHCWRISDAREELNSSMGEGRIESRHYIKSILLNYNIGVSLLMVA